jgi:hypothetical protein
MGRSLAQVDYKGKFNLSAIETIFTRENIRTVGAASAFEQVRKRSNIRSIAWLPVDNYVDNYEFYKEEVATESFDGLDPQLVQDERVCPGQRPDGPSAGRRWSVSSTDH